jgi:hypothetical protein
MHAAEGALRWLLPFEFTVDQSSQFLEFFRVDAFGLE